jgi:hypothetical protein
VNTTEKVNLENFIKLSRSQLSQLNKNMLSTKRNRETTSPYNFLTNNLVQSTNTPGLYAMSPLLLNNLNINPSIFLYNPFNNQNVPETNLNSLTPTPLKNELNNNFSSIVDERSNEEILINDKTLKKMQSSDSLFQLPILTTKSNPNTCGKKNSSSGFYSWAVQSSPFKKYEKKRSSSNIKNAKEGKI